MASPASTLKVVYIGEAGIDTGTLRKEFLTGEFFYFIIFGCLKRFVLKDDVQYL